ncbi:Cysteine alpha-hairpin motif superfamily [Melia azedarach]|uniref:Cysteine alpha-hairpin motif superfamily n=1 Tax=Melia azedarach TaxID=155640 RepID=A0ACC1XM04_MELAZ|nr:Cysteine alpha-hairpin motif superfamily [Melia azedarach]
MEKTSDKPECAQQAMDLLNCVTQSPFDQDKCLHLLNVLRECVVNKKVKKFSLADQAQPETNPSNKKP